jgi:ketosteroid isomerase-like protein
MEFPYTPSGGIPRVEGRSAIADYVAGVAKMIAIDEVTLLASHHVIQSNIVVLEFTGRGSGVQTGKPYDQTYISVITLRGGYIVHYRDYWNPMVALETLGGTEAIAVALRGEGDSHA